MLKEIKRRAFLSLSRFARQGKAAHFSLVARPPADIAAALARIAGELRQYGAQHYYYPPETIHFTVQNLDRVRDRRADREWLEELVRVVGSCGKLSCRAKGLSLAPHTVFVRVHTDGDSLERIRAAVRRLGGGALWRRVLLRLFAHANLVRFHGPLSLRFIRAVRRLHGADFGSFEVSELELVETDKVLSVDGTRILGRIPLAAGREARILSA